MIKSTIQPTRWDDVGGAGSLSLFEPTLDIVVNATEDVHEQIDVLLDRLRKLPSLAGGTGVGGGPPRPTPSLPRRAPISTASST